MRKFCMFAWRFAVVALLAANFLYTAAVSVQVTDAHDYAYTQTDQITDCVRLEAVASLTEAVDHASSGEITRLTENYGDLYTMIDGIVEKRLADMPKPVAEMSRENIKAALGEIEFEVRPRMGSSRPKLTDTR